MEILTDALLNEIKIGHKYGYTQNPNGVASVVVGVVSKINEETKKVTLKDVMERRGAYGVGVKDEFVKQDRARSVYGCMLFPVNQ